MAPAHFAACPKSRVCTGVAVFDGGHVFDVQFDKIPERRQPTDPRTDWRFVAVD
jgi:hypothetical protein